MRLNLQENISELRLNLKENINELRLNLKEEISELRSSNGNRLTIIEKKLESAAVVETINFSSQILSIFNLN